MYKYEWDEPLPRSIQHEWITLTKDLELAMETEISRQYFTNSTNESNTELHVFVDASQQAYGSAVYLTSDNESKLVFAKGRVVPLKTLTLPQLELMAAVIGARIASRVTSALTVNKTTYWSDSQIVLQRLASNKQMKKFLRNRVSEIKSLTNDSD